MRATITSPSNFCKPQILDRSWTFLHLSLQMKHQVHSPVSALAIPTVYFRKGMEITLHPHSIHPTNHLPVLSHKTTPKPETDPSPTEGGKETSAGFVTKVQRFNVPPAKVGYAIPVQFLQESVSFSMSTQKWQLSAKTTACQCRPNKRLVELLQFHIPLISTQ